jgi:CRISPR-associated protein Csm2
MGDFLANRVRLKTSQIRKFLDAVNEIKSKGTQEKEADFRSACMLLKPKLAYAAGRQDEVKPLMAVLVPCIDRVYGKDDFTRFYRFVESIIAYHRYHGGRD